jgi:tetratricopeptide (TPR) repeat protein
VSKSDWYTRSTWTDQDADAFWARLRRVRDWRNAAQYIRVQAKTLEEHELVDEAAALLERILADYPGNFDLPEVHHQLARCRERRGRIDEAVTHLRSALALEAANPSYQTRAWLTFGRLIVEHRLRSLYPEFLAVADAKADNADGLLRYLIFPVDRYLFSSTLAIIARDTGDQARARDQAKLALAAADRRDSGFRYHPDLGLVDATDTPLYREIASIAGDGQLDSPL